MKNKVKEESDRLVQLGNITTMFRSDMELNQEIYSLNWKRQC